MKYDEFVNEFMPLVEYFKAELSQGVIGLYYRGLRSLSADEFRYAVDKIILSAEFKFMPKVPEILSVLGISQVDAVVQAVDTLNKARQRWGQYRDVCFKDRAIMGAVEHIGGWEKVCLMSESEWDKFAKWDFKELYLSYQKRPHDCPTELLGIASRQNSQNNQENPEADVKYIGFSDDELNKIGARYNAISLQKHKELAYKTKQKERAMLNKGAQMITDVAKAKRISA